jgi:hypothetical protein
VTAPALALKDVGETTHDGKVVSVTAEKLVMTGKDGKEHAHALNADSKVCIDGKVVKPEDLKPGLKIRVTVKNDAKEVAFRIEALENNEKFSSTQDGKIVSAIGNKLIMTNKDGEKVICTLMENAQVTIDGKASKFEDLKPGTQIRVTVQGDGKQLTSQVEAIVNNDNFENRS